MNVIGWLIVGLVVGTIAKLLMPGRDPAGWIVMILLGMLGMTGSFVGGLISSDIYGATKGWIGSVVGAVFLLFLYRIIVGPRKA
jgi:uncharacterized membrane protein YeaQ/YmgE (transglycosylase-associated protein family)